MNALKKLLALDPAEKSRLGVEHTAAEIHQQPDTWSKIAPMFRDQVIEIRSFLYDAGLMGDRSSVIVTTGAGSSEFIGSAVSGLLKERLGREVVSIPTTHLVTHARTSFASSESYTVISFARSGNSPESVATLDRVRRYRPDARHIIITCNGQGELSRAAAADPRTLCLVLPEETHDRSLVMTSSFSTMALTAAALGYVDALDEFESISSRLSAGARQIFEVSDSLKAFAEQPFSRACFLGSGTLFATMQECQLKLQEMTEGRVASRFESFLGLRHGPQVFVNEDCVVVAGIASDPLVRRYELDMLGELKSKGQGRSTLVICDQVSPGIEAVSDFRIDLFPDGTAVPDSFRIMTDVVVGQLLGMFKSMAVGLKPDNPSTSGVINRVVQGVVIYDN